MISGVISGVISDVISDGATLPAGQPRPPAMPPPAAAAAAMAAAAWPENESALPIKRCTAADAAGAGAATGPRAEVRRRGRLRRVCGVGTRVGA